MFDRIVYDPAILGGKPIIRGTRISVEVAAGGERGQSGVQTMACEARNTQRARTLRISL